MRHVIHVHVVESAILSVGTNQPLKETQMDSNKVEWLDFYGTAERGEAVTTLRPHDNPDTFVEMLNEDVGGTTDKPTVRLHSQAICIFNPACKPK